MVLKQRWCSVLIVLAVLSAIALGAIESYQQLEGSWKDPYPPDIPVRPDGRVVTFTPIDASTDYASFLPISLLDEYNQAHGTATIKAAPQFPSSAPISPPPPGYIRFRLNYPLHSPTHGASIPCELTLHLGQETGSYYVCADRPTALYFFDVRDTGYQLDFIVGDQPFVQPRWESSSVILTLIRSYRVENLFFYTARILHPTRMLYVTRLLEIEVDQPHEVVSLMSYVGDYTDSYPNNTLYRYEQERWSLSDGAYYHRSYNETEWKKGRFALTHDPLFAFQRGDGTTEYQVLDISGSEFSGMRSFSPSIMADGLHNDRGGSILGCTEFFLEFVFPNTTKSIFSSEETLSSSPSSTSTSHSPSRLSKVDAFISEVQQARQALVSPSSSPSSSLHPTPEPFTTSPSTPFTSSLPHSLKSSSSSLTTLLHDLLRLKESINHLEFLDGQPITQLSSSTSSSPVPPTSYTTSTNSPHPAPSPSTSPEPSPIDVLISSSSQHQPQVDAYRYHQARIQVLNHRIKLLLRNHSLNDTHSDTAQTGSTVMNSDLSASARSSPSHPPSLRPHPSYSELMSRLHHLSAHAQAVQLPIGKAAGPTTSPAVDSHWFGPTSSEDTPHLGNDEDVGYILMYWNLTNLFNEFEKCVVRVVDTDLYRGNVTCTRSISLPISSFAQPVIEGTVYTPRGILTALIEGTNLNLETDGDNTKPNLITDNATVSRTNSDSKYRKSNDARTVKLTLVEHVRRGSIFVGSPFGPAILTLFKRGKQPSSTEWPSIFAPIHSTDISRLYGHYCSVAEALIGQFRFPVTSQARVCLPVMYASADSNARLIAITNSGFAVVDFIPPHTTHLPYAFTTLETGTTHRTTFLTTPSSDNDPSGYIALLRSCTIQDEAEGKCPSTFPDETTEGVIRLEYSNCDYLYTDNVIAGFKSNEGASYFMHNNGFSDRVWSDSRGRLVRDNVQVFQFKVNRTSIKDFAFIYTYPTTQETSNTTTSLADPYIPTAVEGKLVEGITSPMTRVFATVRAQFHYETSHTTLDSFEADCLGHDYFILEKGVGEVRQHGFHYQALLEEWKKIEASNPSVASVAPSRSVTSPTTPPLTPVAHSSTALPSSPSSSSRPSITPLRIDPEPPHFYGRHSNDGDFYSRGLWVHHGSEGSRCKRHREHIRGSSAYFSASPLAPNINPPDPSVSCRYHHLPTIRRGVSACLTGETPTARWKYTQYEMYHHFTTNLITTRPIFEYDFVYNDIYNNKNTTINDTHLLSTSASSFLPSLSSSLPSPLASPHSTDLPWNPPGSTTSSSLTTSHISSDQLTHTRPPTKQTNLLSSVAKPQIALDATKLSIPPIPSAIRRRLQKYSKDLRSTLTGMGGLDGLHKIATDTTSHIPVTAPSSSLSSSLNAETSITFTLWEPCMSSPTVPLAPEVFSGSYRVRVLYNTLIGPNWFANDWTRYISIESKNTSNGFNPENLSPTNTQFIGTSNSRNSNTTMNSGENSKDSLVSLAASLRAQSHSFTSSSSSNDDEIPCDNNWTVEYLPIRTDPEGPRVVIRGKVYNHTCEITFYKDGAVSSEDTVSHNALGSCTKPDGEKIEIQADYNVIDEGFIIVRIFDRALHDTHPYRSRVSAATIPSNHMSFVMQRCYKDASHVARALYGTLPMTAVDGDGRSLVTDALVAVHDPPVVTRSVGSSLSSPSSSSTSASLLPGPIAVIVATPTVRTVTSIPSNASTTSYVVTLYPYGKATVLVVNTTEPSALNAEEHDEPTNILYYTSSQSKLSSKDSVSSLASTINPAMLSGVYGVHPDGALDIAVGPITIDPSEPSGYLTKVVSHACRYITLKIYLDTNPSPLNETKTPEVSRWGVPGTQFEKCIAGKKITPSKFFDSLEVSGSIVDIPTQVHMHLYKRDPLNPDINEGGFIYASQYPNDVVPQGLLFNKVRPSGTYEIPPDTPPTAQDTASLDSSLTHPTSCSLSDTCSIPTETADSRTLSSSYTSTPSGPGGYQFVRRTHKNIWKAIRTNVLDSLLPATHSGLVKNDVSRYSTPPVLPCVGSLLINFQVNIYQRSAASLTTSANGLGGARHSDSTSDDVRGGMSSLLSEAGTVIDINHDPWMSQSTSKTFDDLPYTTVYEKPSSIILPQSRLTSSTAAPPSLSFTSSLWSGFANLYTSFSTNATHSIATTVSPSTRLPSSSPMSDIGVPQQPFTATDFTQVLVEFARATRLNMNYLYNYVYVDSKPKLTATMMMDTSSPDSPSISPRATSIPSTTSPSKPGADRILLKSGFIALALTNGHENSAEPLISVMNSFFKGRNSASIISHPHIPSNEFAYEFEFTSLVVTHDMSMGYVVPPLPFSFPKSAIAGISIGAVTLLVIFLVVRYRTRYRCLRRGGGCAYCCLRSKDYSAYSDDDEADGTQAAELDYKYLVGSSPNSRPSPINAVVNDRSTITHPTTVVSSSNNNDTSRGNVKGNNNSSKSSSHGNNISNITTTSLTSSNIDTPNSRKGDARPPIRKGLYGF